MDNVCWVMHPWVGLTAPYVSEKGLRNGFEWPLTFILDLGVFSKVGSSQ